jgi:hypothetical protein
MHLQAHILHLERALALERERNKKIKADYAADKRLSKLEATQTDQILKK